MNLRDEWTKISHTALPNFGKDEIIAMVFRQTKGTSSQLVRYLWFDLVLKLITLTGLLVAIVLIYPNATCITLVIAFIGGIASCYIEYQLINKNYDPDYSRPIRLYVSDVLHKTRLKINHLAIIVGITNPLIILSGSYLYLYAKYGQELTRSLEDIIVTGSFMVIGFMVNYLAFSFNQNSQLNDLEVSNYMLISEDDSGIAIIARRRKRRMIISISLMLLGFLVFLFLLIGYFNFA